MVDPPQNPTTPRDSYNRNQTWNVQRRQAIRQLQLLPAACPVPRKYHGFAKAEAGNNFGERASTSRERNCCAHEMCF